MSPAEPSREENVYMAKLAEQDKPCRVRRRSRVSLASSSMPSPRQRGIFPVLPRRTAQQAFQQVLPVSLLPMQEHNLPLSLLSVPVKKDLLQKLQEPKVIMPQPVRSIGSSISIGPIEAMSTTVQPPVKIAGVLSSARLGGMMVL